MPEPIDKLEIEIEASATGAEAKLNRVIGCLEGVSAAAAKVLNPLKKFRTAIDTGRATRQLKTMQKAMEDVSKTATGKMRESIKKSLPGFDATKFSKSLERVDAEITKTDDRIKRLQSTIAYLKMPVSGVSAIGKLGVDEELGEVEKKLAELQKVRSLLSEQRSTLWADMEKQTAGAGMGVEIETAIKDANIFREILDRLSVACQNAGAKLKDLAHAAVSLAGRGFEKLGNAIHKTGSRLFAEFTRPITDAAGAFTKFRKTLGRVVLFRAVRQAIKMIADAAKEGFENFKAFSDSVGNEFSASMKSISASALYLKNSLGALAAPLVNSIAPAIDTIINKFVALINVINMVVSLLSGRGTYFRAVRGSSAATISMGGAMDKVKVASVSAAKSMNDVGIATISANSAMDGIALASLEAKSAVDDIAVASLNTKNAMDGIALASVTAKEDIAETVKAASAVNTGMDGVSVASTASEELKDNLKGAEKSAKDIRRYLIGIDELNVMPDQSTAGGGGGGGGGIGADIGGMFEEVPLPDWLSDVKAAFDAGKWYEVGELLADKLNGVVDRLDTRGWGRKLGTKITNGLQIALGFMRRFSFFNLGAKISDGLNGVMETLDTDTAGRLFTLRLTSMVDLALGFFDQLDFSLLAQKISDFFIGALDEATMWLNSYDWSEVGVILWQKLKDAITGIKFSSLASTLFTFLGTAVRSAAKLIGGFFGSVAGDIKTWWNNDIKGTTWTETAGNLLSAIGDALGDVGGWAMENVVDPFMNALLGEEKWSETKEAIVTAVEGIRTGISEKWEAIKTKTSEAWERIKTKTSETWAKVKETTSSTWEEIKEKVRTSAETARDKLGSAWESAKQTTSTTWESIKQSTSTAWENVKTKIGTSVETAKTKIGSAWDAAKTKTSTVWASIKTTVSEKASSIASKISEKFNAAKDTVSTVFESIRAKIQEKIEAAKNKVAEVIEKIKGLFNFSWSLPHINLPHFKITGYFNVLGASIPKIGIDWYGKAMDEAMVLNGATIFGQAGGKLLGGGEVGREVVAGEDHLLKMMKKTVSEAFAEADRNFQFSPAVFADYSPQFAMNGPAWEDAAGNSQDRNDISRREQMETTIDAFLGAANRIIRAIEEKSTTINVDGHKLGSMVTKEQNRQYKMYGRSLVKH